VCSGAKNVFVTRADHKPKQEKTMAVSPLSMRGQLRTAMTQMTGVSKGDAKQAMLQALGWNQRDAALSGAMTDLRRGDLAGYQKNMFEAFTGVDPGRMAKGMCGAHSMHSPSAALGTSVERMNLKKFTKGSFGSKLLGFALGGPIGALIGNSLSKKKKAKCLEKRLNRNPMFRAQFEAAVGGKFVPDGRNDGKITIVRNNFNLPGLNRGCFGSLGGNMVAGGAMSGLARMMGNAARLMGSFGIGGGFGGGIGNAFGGYNSLQPGLNPNLKQKFGLDRQSGGPGSAVARLPANATFEDLVAAFMIDTVKDMQDEAKAKMDEIKKSNQSRNRRGYGGMMGGLGGIAGGVLGGMVGGPIGSSIGGQLGGAAGQAIGGGGGQKGSDSRNLMFEELKNIMQKVQQMQQALSNVLNTMHQGAMNSIRNIRA
jgi:hypothetical protein